MGVMTNGFAIVPHWGTQTKDMDGGTDGCAIVPHRGTQTKGIDLGTDG